MSESQDEAGDKPYEASPRKLEEARKKGEIARSQDTVTLGALVFFIIALTILFSNIMPNQVMMIQGFVRQAIISSEATFGAKTSNEVWLWVRPILLTVFLLPPLLLLIGLIAAKQLIFTQTNLALKLNRISPIANAKKKYGLSGLFEFGKTVLKFSVFSIIFTVFLYASSSLFDDITLLAPHFVLERLYTESLRWFIVATLAYVIFAAIDIAWQTREHAKKNRMSHKELKDEQKNEEGDEMVRQQRRAKAEEIATNRMLLDVPKASVVITNPTHYAVALKWSGDSMGVPTCVARGKDETARRIREIAIQSGIPLFRDPPTARDLYANVKMGRSIDRDHYKAVAIAISYAQRIKKMAADDVR
jgi:flagellar biosynthetic protein FlhB